MSQQSGWFNLRCALGLHAWAKWSAPEAVTMTVKAQSLAGVWMQVAEPWTQTVWRQERTCSLCGKTQRRVVET